MSSNNINDRFYYDYALSSYIYNDVYAEMAKAEMRHYRPGSYQTNPLDIKCKLRRILVDFMAEFCEKNKINPLARSLAIYLFDHYNFDFNKAGEISCPVLYDIPLPHFQSYSYLKYTEKIVKLMQVCMVIAAKTEEVHYNVPNFEDFGSVKMQVCCFFCFIYFID